MISKIAGDFKNAIERIILMNIWLLKPEGLYDNIEPDVDNEWFEEEEYECQMLGTYRGWRFKPAR